MSSRVRSWLATGAVLVALGTVVGLGWRDRDRFAIVSAGQTAPGFALPTIDGDTVSLASFRGRVVLLNLWATWCAPCLWEMPSMERAYQEFKGQGFEIVAVSLDAAPDDPATLALVRANVRDFVAQLGLSFTILRDPRGELERSYTVSSLPTSFLIDRDGRIAQRILGPAEWDKEPHRSMILELLGS